jgi:hypothetical protein
MPAALKYAKSLWTSTVDRGAIRATGGGQLSSADRKAHGLASFACNRWRALTRATCINRAQQRSRILSIDGARFEI